MPEGDTIFRSARALNRALAEKVVTRFETAYAHLASVDDDKKVVGRTVERVEARGKWLLMYFSGDLILVTHMRMNGSWHLYRTGERWRRPRRDMRIVIETADWSAVGFAVPVAEFHSAASLLRRTMIPALGPDLLKQDFDFAGAIAGMQEYADEQIADVLLNQRVMAGIGNVYKSETCFICGVNPFRQVRTLDPSQLEQLVFTARKFLALNVAEDADGEISTYAGLRRTTDTSNQSARLWVYGRRGEPCRRCGTPIEMRKQGVGARTTF
ncbi:MAG TPA: DNA-formamidopyrimidine glycosylase family protein, partial [Acidobacteriaceae bacterium]|nr:DNA-formamidopyrimidine glycosylase family protein [Acidobacteriaceae bacterium]